MVANWACRSPRRDRVASILEEKTAKLCRKSVVAYLGVKKNQLLEICEGLVFQVCESTMWLDPQNLPLLDSHEVQQRNKHSNLSVFCGENVVPGAHSLLFL